MINIICSKCGKKYGERQDNKQPVIESHGYCKDCFEIEIKEIEKIKLKTGGQILVKFCDRMMGN